MIRAMIAFWRMVLLALAAKHVPPQNAEHRKYLQFTLGINGTLHWI